MEKPVILIVDDQYSNLVAFEALLEEFDAELLQASSGVEALRYVREREITLVLLDVQMPNMDGFEVAQCIQKLTCSRPIPIIFVTAINKDHQYVVRGYESGAVDYLSKPVDPAILLSKVKIFLDLDSKTKAMERLNRELENSVEHLERLCYDHEQLLQSIGHGVLRIDEAGHIIYSNKAVGPLFSTSEDILGFPLANFIDAEEPQEEVDRIVRVCQSGKTYTSTLRCKRGKIVFPAHIHGTVLQYDNKIIGYSLVIQDFTERERREQELLAETERDALTNLCNRRGLDNLLSRRMLYTAEETALLYMDLDGFKPINDKYGHKCGDQLLKTVGDRMLKVLRQSDVVARIGGDEFCVVLTEQHSLDNAQRIAQKLVDVVSQPISLDQGDVSVGISIGIAQGQAGQTPEELLHAADIAMYESKRQGGKHVRVADQGESEVQSA